MKYLLKLYDHIVTLMAYFAAFLLAFMTGSIAYQVVTRYLFNSPTIWVNDLTEYILLGATFLGGAFVLKEGKHISVDLIIGKLNIRKKLVFDSVSSFLGALVCLILTGYSLVVVWENFQRNIIVIKTIETPKYLVLLPIFIGSLLMTIQFILNVKTKFVQLRNIDKEAGEMEKTIELL